GKSKPAEPGQDTVRPERPFQSLGHRLQQQIADAMAERVVDRLEAIKVKEQHGKFIILLRGRSLPADLIKCSTEYAPVRQAGERVFGRKPGDMRLRLAPVGDVSECM